MTRTFLTIPLLLLLLSGCASIGSGGNLLNRLSESRRLSEAIDHLEKGNLDAAATVLEGITRQAGVSGVTDEALFRLAVIRLQNSKDGASQTTALLERLIRDYPESPWTKQGVPLLEYVSSIDDARKQARTLKILNIALTRDNKELRATNQNLVKENKEIHQNIEKLKHLDIELEKKTR
ncbi:tetratricopeptide repeat protein [Geobacter argillaceus]|uniref:Tetratricopeptide repeat protein n=1 Tax=Geobacter argillaceus TaxID=345631 RepID=A0A562VGK8_9BACT|nr:tetratricopeptide repeat protein [Geobacter argillaceus]TWJ17056.1 hypothetical protein JN12_03168 [Geobacter argillaceus]